MAPKKKKKMWYQCSMVWSIIGQSDSGSQDRRQHIANWYTAYFLDWYFLFRKSHKTSLINLTKLPYLWHFRNFFPENNQHGIWPQNFREVLGKVWVCLFNFGKEKCSFKISFPGIHNTTCPSDKEWHSGRECQSDSACPEVTKGTIILSLFQWIELCWR